MVVTIRRTLCLAGLLLPLAACSVIGPQTPDDDQLKRMRAEDIAARTQESIGCVSRDRVCAQLVQLRGQACTRRADDMLGTTPAERTDMRRCSLADARRLPGLLPTDAPASEQEAAVSTVFDAWRGALDANDPAASPAGLMSAENQLKAMPGGSPYAATLGAASLTHAAIGDPAASDPCRLLSEALAALPASPPATLAPRVALERATATEAKSKKDCQP